MKRAHYTYGIDRSGKNYWRSLGELAGSKEFREALEREFPEGASEGPDGFNRRQFLSIMGASFGLAGLAACRRPEENILPYSRAPEQVVPGKPEYFATALPLMGTAIGLLVESHEGRPTKIEGNPLHPDSLGAANSFAQASILDLYDPDRSTSPREKGAPRSWSDAQEFLARKGRELKEKKGRGLVVLTEGHRSPTLAAALSRLQEAMPEAKVVRHEPFSRASRRAGNQIAFGRPLETVWKLDEARVIAALDCDLLGLEGSPVKQSAGFARGRRVEKPGDKMNRLYSVESAFTLTGANADHRLRLRRSELPAFVAALARALGKAGVNLGEGLDRAPGSAEKGLDEKALAFAKALAKDLASNSGRALVAAGSAQPPAVHAAVAAINSALKADGRTVHYLRPFDAADDGPASLAALAEEMRAGKVETLLVLGGNPAFDGPGTARFAEALGKVPLAIHLSTHFDETSEKSAWHLNRAHYLEAWSDVRAEDGTASVIQPLIAPLFAGRTDAEVVSLLAGAPKKAYELVRQTWSSQFGGALGSEIAWRRALHDGLLAGSAYPSEQAEPRAAEIAQAFAALPAARPGLEVTFHADGHAYDGRFANNGWLQELPDPMTKVSWDNAALLAPATASRLGLVEGDLIEISADGRSAKAPVVIAPGQAEDSLALTLGQGRTAVGRVGKGVGFDAYPLRGHSGADLLAGASAKKTGQTFALARTQEHSAMEGRPLVREATLARFEGEPDFAKKMVEAPPLKSLFDDVEYQGQRWGMAIDLNACTGCNACTVACQAENNIPIVGKSGVLRSREMHWIRVDRYFEGAAEEPKAVFQPIGCQHCENAPCEQVCPVGATTHSAEGLNDMAYNRCVGTRYCANNCPYKVRRFNFFNYAKDLPELRKMQMNPDVTVRARGVMEKCTYCVQRIQEAKIAAKREGRDRVRDGEVRSACQQSCPTGAITFGDLADPESAVARLTAQPRSYALLGELNVRPRTQFLARVRNPNPELEAA